MFEDKNIYLIGYMGCGKTTLMNQVKKELGVKSIDLDAYIEETCKITIAEIFEEFGEEFFRELESRSIQDMGNLAKHIISTGGGAPCFHNNMEQIKQQGISIYIKVSPNELSKRLFPNKETRPIIKNFNDQKELEKFIAENIQRREEFYMSADIIIESDNITSEDIIFALENYND